MIRYTVMMTQNRGIQTDRGRGTKKLGNENEQSKRKLALKPQVDRERKEQLASKLEVES